MQSSQRVDLSTGCANEVQRCRVDSSQGEDVPGELTRYGQVYISKSIVAL